MILIVLFLISTILSLFPLSAGNQSGVNSAKSPAKDRTRYSIRSPGDQKTTSSGGFISPALAVTPKPEETKLFINKKKGPSNQENSDKRVRVRDRVKQIEENQKKKMKP